MGLTPLQPGWPTVGELVFMQASPYDWNGVPVSVSRSGYTGEDGFEISLPDEALTAFADALCAMEEVKPIDLGARDSLRRSEEHTSELQSLMRISYAVFSLKQKRHHKH